MLIAPPAIYPTVPVSIISSVSDLARYLINIASHIPKGSGVYVMLDSSLSPEHVETLSKILESLGFKRVDSFPGRGVIVRREGREIVFEAVIDSFITEVARISEHEIQALAEEIQRIRSRRSKRVRKPYTQPQDQQPPQGQQPSRGLEAPSPQG